MTWKLFYDGGCNLCHTSKLKVERWAATKGQDLQAIPFQSSEGIERGYLNGPMVLEADQIYKGADAWMQLSLLAPWWLQILFVPARLPGLNLITRMVYNLIAKYRIKLFGSRECQIPQAR